MYCRNLLNESALEKINGILDGLILEFSLLKYMEGSALSPHPPMQAAFWTHFIVVEITSNTKPVNSIFDCLFEPISRLSMRRSRLTLTDN